MNQFFKNLCIISLSIIFIFLLFKNPEISKSSISVSFNIWKNNLVPSIFPIIIISDILINYNFIDIVSPLFYKVFNKLFHLSYNGTYFLIMSLFIGTPSNAILLNNMINNNYINLNEANKLIYICYFSNPLFLYNTLSLIFNKYTVIEFIIIHYLANFIILFLIRKKYIPIENINNIIIKRNNILELLTSSIKNAINTMITILGIICFYMLIANQLKFNSLFSGILEITSGLFLLVKSSFKYKSFICIMLINFGGLSIFSQIKSILEDTNINFINYFKGRLLQIIIALLLFIILKATTQIIYNTTCFSSIECQCYII